MGLLAQQRLGTPDTDTGGWRHRKLWLVFLPFLRRLLREFQERGPGCHPEVSTSQTRPGFRGRELTQMSRGFPAHSDSFSFFS